jgi:dipeptidyl aminopeptidase/acylaminoacyl peptidase
MGLDPTMSNTVQHLLIAILLLASTVRGDEAETRSLQELEEPRIDKIAQLTAKEHSTILFSIADRLIGYAKDGHIEWINSNHNPRRVACAWPHPTLSHDGLHVAFVSDANKPEHCRIVIRDMPSGVDRELVETADDPGEISWSWDDTEIAFFDHGISAVSVRDGVKRLLLPYPMKRIRDYEFTFWVWNPMQWLHNGKDLVVELSTEIPTKEPGSYNQRSNLLLVGGGDARVIDIGSQPAVSPISDRIAYYASEGVVAINADTTGKTVLAKAPRTMLFFKDELFWKIVWSPDGNRLFFGTIVSEDRRDNLYLLDVKSGRREHFLSHTSITIRDWR